jgi:hypothetical protein
MPYDTAKSSKKRLMQTFENASIYQFSLHASRACRLQILFQGKF